MVPLGNVAFTLPFVPQHQPLRVTDIIGLVVICGGLGCYRFAAKFVESCTKNRPYSKDGEEKKDVFANLLSEEEGNPLH